MSSPVTNLLGIVGLFPQRLLLQAQATLESLV